MKKQYISISRTEDGGYRVSFSPDGRQQKVFTFDSTGICVDRAASRLHAGGKYFYPPPSIAECDALLRKL